MKRVIMLLAAGGLVILMNASAWGQTTYTWNVDSGEYGVNTNWDPSRDTPATDDILVFDGNTQATPTVTNVNTETIGRLVLTNNVSVSMFASLIERTVTIAGGTGTDFDVPAGSALSIGGVLVALSISLSTGATGIVGGSFSMDGYEHLLLAADANGITFQDGSTCAIGSAFSGNPFGTTSLNSVVFAGGSVFSQVTGDDPFGASQPNSVVVFQAGSLFRLEGAITPSFSGRAYADYEHNNGVSTSVTGSNAVAIDNLTITSGTLNFNMTGTPGHSIRGDITIADGATLSFDPASAGTVNLNGISAQTISGEGTLSSNTNSTLVINNPQGVFLRRHVTFNSLTFQSGNLFVGDYDLTLEGSVSGAGPGKCVVIDGTGQICRTMDASESFTFPVAPTATSYNPVTITQGPSDPSETICVVVVEGVSPAAPDNSTAVQRTWKISETTPGGNNAQLTFQWTAAEEGGAFDRGTSSIWRYQSTAWVLLDDVSLTGSDPYTAESISTDLSPSGIYLIGNTAGLPVQLTAFSATVHRFDASLLWSTTTETNNFGFEVERRGISQIDTHARGFESRNEAASYQKDSSPWTTIAFVPGSGTSSSPKGYSFVDREVTPGRYAYRIKQIDHDGSFAYTDAVELEVGSAPLEFTFSQNYPNPFNPTATIEFTLPEDGRVVLKVYDLQGQEVATLVDEERKAGIYQQVVFDASRLATGFYVARLQAGGKQLVKKMMLVK